MTGGIPGFLSLPMEAGPPVLSVSEFNRAVKGVLEDDFGGVWVQGEIDGWKVHRNGHRYFTLKDDSAAVSCVMWRSAAAQLPMDPDNGMRVRVFGGATLWEGAGRFQLTVRRLEPEDGEGYWKRAFEQMRERLEQEGLLAPERKRPLPRFPGTVGVVTSISGAALRDILSVIRRRAPWTRVLVMDARVQGEGAAREIAAGIRTLGARDDVDVLIVGRGGGSREDLWAFNEEPVARAIAECPVPVVSAVGHEVDVSISDLVADLRAPTPSAAAEAVVRDRETLLRQLGTVRLRLRRGLLGAVEARRRRLEDAPRRLARAVQSRTRPLDERVAAARRRLVRSIETILTDRARRADVGPGLERAVRRRVEGAGAALAAAAGRLEALSPLATVARGYAIPVGEEGQVLKSTAQFVPGAPFRLRVSDGTVGCRVEEILEEGEA